MNLQIVNLIPKNDKIVRDINGPYAEYKYTFHVVMNGYAQDNWMSGINNIADELMLNPIKVQKQMEKFGGINLKEKMSNSYFTKQYTYTYFKTEEEALKAKEWIESMLLNIQIVGKDKIRQERKNKSIENQTKKVQKHFNKLLAFKGKQVIINITTNNSSFNMNDILVNVILNIIFLR